LLLFSRSKQSRLYIKDQVSSVQVEYAMHRDMGNDEAAMGCIARIQELQRELAALKNFKRGNTTTATNESTRSSMEDPPPPVEEVDLTGEDHLLSSNGEVDITGENNVEVNDSEAEQDVEEMYTNGAEV
jgi:hypothetical protein